MTSTINILPTTRIGQCGAEGKGKKQKLYFPFFMLGTCGDDRGVLSYGLYNPYLPFPKKMDRAWFGSIAKHLAKYPLFDWDSSSFRKNVLLPNKEHIREACGITSDEILDRLLRDADVLLNNYDKYTDAEWREECELEDGQTFGKEGDEVGFPPNAKYFFTETNLEY